MIKKIISFLVFTVLFTGLTAAQNSGSTSELFKRTDEKSGKLIIVQDPAADSLINRYILMNIRQYGGAGMDGWRIQIYGSSNRNAREESSKARQDFINRFPDIKSYLKYSEPGYFKIRVGDFRTKSEATKLFMAVSRVFPDAYLVPDIIDFPEQNRK
jgi:hypothetical protein